MAQKLPIFVDLTGRKVLLVGAGAVALEKLPKLYQAGAFVVIVANEVSQAVEDYITPRTDRIRLCRRDFSPADVKGCALVFSATAHTGVNRLVGDVARCHNILFNAADQAEFCDFFMAGAIHRGPLTVAVSSHGTHPGLTRATRLALEELIPQEHIDPLQTLVRLRSRIRENLANPATRLSALREIATQIQEKYFPQQLVPLGIRNGDRHVAQ